MRIGELAKLSNPTRSLRYYEEQGRSSRGAWSTGTAPTTTTSSTGSSRSADSSTAASHPDRQPHPALPRPAAKDHRRRSGPELLKILAEERDRMTDRIDCLTRNRDAINGYLDAVNQATAQRRAGGAA